MKKFIILVLVSIVGILNNAYADNFKEALNAFDKKDYQKAFSLFLPLAETGHPLAQYNIGYMYDNGFGVEKNKNKALKWYVLSAEQDDVDAMYNLGLLYANGEIQEKFKATNFNEAFKWWSLAAQKGDTESQNNIGYMYENGQGVLQDYVKAYMWYDIATKNNMMKAIENKKKISMKMSTEQITKAQQNSIQCIKQNLKFCNRLD